MTPLLKELEEIHCYQNMGLGIENKPKAALFYAASEIQIEFGQNQRTLQVQHIFLRLTLKESLPSWKQ